ncbi:tRNA glutamyl-Q(34) synthetase GluQRS [Psychromonas ingrahamii]|uniref:tRNA glutamyl-Q(34) synthetase GluQRS n=1 Tax=Psychromonas ingrahamii TaxID=357794 RepID=UPI0005A1C3A0|nr:tRNA glutamyl-Q(34) synthetase GluQRS [Psychromonas ingrahamii]
MPKPVIYRGRFAPSPSGPMHFGSLVAALGSYLQARSQHGSWQVRIDDIDPPREVKGAAQDILLTLQAYGLNWDGEVIYQSHNSQSYENVLSQLTERQLCYACACSRKIIRQSGGLYQGTCRNKQLPEINHALRINLYNMTHPVTYFDDQLQGSVVLDKKQATEDFIIRRKEGLYAYNLATVIDDINQGITEIVRGADLLNTTGKQLTLYQLLNKKPPGYLHLPVAVTAPGNKLSKQNHALAISKDNPRPTLLAALRFLGHTVPQEMALNSCFEILKWAIQNWSLDKLPQLAEIQIKN